MERLWNGKRHSVRPSSYSLFAIRYSLFAPSPAQPIRLRIRAPIADVGERAGVGGGLERLAEVEGIGGRAEAFEMRETALAVRHVGIAAVLDPPEREVSGAEQLEPLLAALHEAAMHRLVGELVKRFGRSPNRHVDDDRRIVIGPDLGGVAGP